MSKEERHTLSEDNDIITGILKGKKGSLEKLYEINFPVVTRMILNNGGDIDDAKDVFQEAVIILYDKVTCGDFKLNSKLKTYVYSVSRNLWLKKLTRKGVFTNIKDYEERMVVDDDLEKHHEKDQQFTLMENALVRLGEPCKTIIEDFYIHNLSMQEICEKFGYTNTDNAKNQKYKCLQRLKKLFFS
ncbi:sigma-70 family RNA polymerase sigma factor [Olivibacter sp. SDN3]|uniref:RNA polymerase sigma factor n=1 Tax=Olivibacter sp. SDN3 TaxID=2764720 RepID=UPI001650E0EB|nr:sigma-70 family RNA polymerase sigma factor [Olivibacter sp. SDN3]QNL48856.1 sigma-70 family RNA polymerase sigma factor [Olivibacter sp. SDN3]